MDKRVDILKKKMKRDFKKVFNEVCSHYNLSIAFKNMTYNSYYHNLCRLKSSYPQDMYLEKSSCLFVKYFIGYIKCYKPTYYYQYLRKHMKYHNCNRYDLFIQNVSFKTANHWFYLLEETF